MFVQNHCLYDMASSGTNDSYLGEMIHAVAIPKRFYRFQFLQRDQLTAVSFLSTFNFPLSSAIMFSTTFCLGQQSSRLSAYISEVKFAMFNKLASSGISSSVVLKSVLSQKALRILASTNFLLYFELKYREPPFSYVIFHILLLTALYMHFNSAMEGVPNPLLIMP